MRSSAIVGSIPHEILGAPRKLPRSRFRLCFPCTIIELISPKGIKHQGRRRITSRTAQRPPIGINTERFRRKSMDAGIILVDYDRGMKRNNHGGAGCG